MTARFRYWRSKEGVTNAYCGIIKSGIKSGKLITFDMWEVTKAVFVKHLACLWLLPSLILAKQWSEYTCLKGLKRSRNVTLSRVKGAFDSCQICYQRWRMSNPCHIRRCQKTFYLRRLCRIFPTFDLIQTCLKLIFPAVEAKRSAWEQSEYFFFKNLLSKIWWREHNFYDNVM